MRLEDKKELFPVQAADQLLAGVSTKDRRKLLLLKKRISLNPGSFLVRAGEMPNGIFIHRRGVVQTIPSRRMENFLEAEEAETESVYGLAETLSGSGFDFSIRSVTSAEFDMIDRDDFFDFIRHRPDLIQRINIAFSAMYRNAVRRLTEE